MAKILISKKDDSFETFNIITENLDTVYIKLEEYKYIEGNHYYYIIIMISFLFIEKLFLLVLLFLKRR